METLALRGSRWASASDCPTCGHVVEYRLNVWRYWRVPLYAGLMIRSFGSKDTERIWHEQYVKRIDKAVQRATLRKLELIHAAKDVEDLRIPPGNRLERLAGDRRGQHSIRVNAQWRLCFVWKEGGAEDVELVDYH